MSSLRKNLKKAMEDRQWSAYDLEAHSGVPQPTTQRFLSGKHGDPRSDTIQKWAAAFGMSEMDLRGRGRDPPYGEATLTTQQRLALSLLNGMTAAQAAEWLRQGQERERQNREVIEELARKG